MKKLFILAVAALVAGAACSKVETSPETQQEVTFQVAKYLPTKANVVYDTAIPFGTYAWFTADDDANANDESKGVDFMVNETVGFVSPVWKTTVHTFYWPKTGTLDFISYSPFNGTNATADSNPAVTKTKLTYTDAVAGDVDFLYADKVTCTSKTANTQAGDITIEKNDDADRTNYTGAQYAGVPTLFHHALAKLSFQIKANFLTWGSGADKTDWKVTLIDFKVGGLFTKGDLELNWDATNGVWTKPAGEIWANPEDKSADQDLCTADLELTTDYQALDALTKAYVLPQELSANNQQLSIRLKIETTLANGNPLIEYYEKTFDLKDISSLSSIKMNQNVVFKVNIKPTANVSTPNSPEDVIINFDPAVADWDTVTSDITIEL